MAVVGGVVKNEVEPGGVMSGVRRGLTLVSVLIALLGGCNELATAQSPLPTTTVQDTVYSANGTPASGTVLVSWGSFTTASGAAIPAGSTSATIGTNGLLTIALAPDAGATPLGSYYTATFHLSDGTTSRSYWIVPVTLAGGGPAKLAAIQMQQLMGIGQPGRLNQLESRVEAHERSVQQLKGLAGAFGGLLTILQVAIAYWSGHRS